MLLAYNYVLKGLGDFSKSAKTAKVKLIPKNNHYHEIKNWRPISLLNVDYKIASKALALRVENVLPVLIHYNQCGFVKGRYIGEAIRTIKDTMEYTQMKKMTGTILFLDFEKALDSVRWKLLHKVLKAHNFGQSFVNWIRIIYKNISSCILNNGFS